MNLLMVSCRHSADAIAFAELTFYRVPPNAEPVSISQSEFMLLAGEKPYLMVHGFREQVNDVVDHFQDVAEKLLWVNASENYTSAIMFTWPSGVKVWFPVTSWVSFKRAQSRIPQAATYLADLLRMLPKTAVYGHSLGAGVILKACLSIEASRLHFAVLAGAACPDYWLSSVLSRSDLWAVLYSREDKVLKYLYSITNGNTKPLGYTGPGSIPVQAVQMRCGHGDYHKQPEFPGLLTWG